ncbi:GpE family phage tail protein [Aliidiomarina sanyensis]|uniref:GpE family phage tail protein n=1 Tax=Aliidiomarina sanyensis TaxID=1249555 RepID=A0A432WB25_9GAMM|nr:GpE family phage tail protein [Aliidiomarina sanyensis]RUO28204.1 GpE family phage tail protein [Aliidiomarina sanyensis]
MADIACVFHWAPEDMAPMELEELAGWREKAIDRLKALNRRE